MKQVLDRFGKRLIIVVTELDTGNERHLTPEEDPHLPVRVAVRMSMGVPGLMEPVAYRGHVYCDGGMTNDFPIDALPDEPGKRIGLVVRTAEWISYAIDSSGGSSNFIDYNQVGGNAEKAIKEITAERQKQVSESSPGHPPRQAAKP